METELPEPGLHTETLDITGMTCASCANFVQRSLSRTPGVRRALVNYATEKATVDYLPAEATPAALKAAVESAGYGVAERAPASAAAERVAETEQQQARTYQHLRRRFGVAAGLTLLIMPLSMLMLWPMLVHVNEQWLNYGLLLLTLPVLLYSGREFYVAAWKALRHGTATMDTLIAVGTGAAFLYSLAATVAPGFFHLVLCFSSSGGIISKTYCKHSVST